MGCLFSKSSESNAKKRGAGDSNEEPKKEYSWDKRPKRDPKDFMFDGLKGETVSKLPGSLDGQQFIIQNCEDCTIYVLDHTATVQIDDCVNCRIFVGPIRQSIFIRDCKDCKVMTACQQFRTRDCHKLDVFLSCTTQPIIEATTGVKFGCFQYNYKSLEEQFVAAGLSVFNNNWSNIHDFTPVTGEINYSLLPEDTKVEDYIPTPTSDEFTAMQISTDVGTSVVPTTLGTRRKPFDESCLVVFFHDGSSQQRARKYMTNMVQNHPECKLVQSKEFPMQAVDAQRVFNSEAYSAAASQGPVIGLQYNGQGVCALCQAMMPASASDGTTSLVFVSTTPQVAAQQIENFYNFADMQMTV